MSAPYPILVLGAYGVFGSRICRRLADDPALHLIVAGRSGARAERLAGSLRAKGAKAKITPAIVDAPAGLCAAFEALRPRLVIHTSGPFQGQNYQVPRLCIENGVNYIDIADDRRFVESFCRFDKIAKKNKVLAVSGASSVPGLSATVIDALRRDIERLDTIEIAIAPGNRAPRGRALVAAILSYVGKEIPRRQGGAWTTVHGWQDLKRRTLSIPGVGSLGPRWLAVCDVPDITLLPKWFPEVRTVTFHAGLELPALHFGLWGLSWLVRGGAVANLQPFARPLRKIATRLDGLGSDRGGMLVRVGGLGKNGRPVTRTWTLIAGTGDGPWIPCLPAVILARKLAHGKIDKLGAGAFRGFMTLDDFAAEARDLDIVFAASDGP